MVLSLAAFVATGAKAQTSMEYGVKAGVNFSTAKGESSSSSGSISASGTGFLVGVYTAFALSDAIKIQPELLYDNYNFKKESTSNLNYLSIPILGKYAFKNIGLSVLAGPQIGFLLSAKDGSMDIKNDFKSINIGLAVGAEYSLPAGFNVSARYNAGLSNIQKSPTDGSSTKLSAFTIAVGYNLSKK